MMTRTALLSAACLAALAAVPLPLAAQGAPGAGDMAEVSLLPGWRRDDGTHMAALRITLAPGWKTYWRAPGEAGIPPAFDWSGSRNLAAVRLHWPVPHVFSNNGMTSIGYARQVILPVELTPKVPGREIDLNAEIAIGVCEDICVPFQASVAGALEPGSRQPDGRIRAALGDRPKTAREAGVGTVTCRLEPMQDGARLHAEVQLPPLGGTELAVIETADPDLWVSGADTGRAGGTLTAEADLVPPSGMPLALDRSGVRITVLGDSGAVDIRGCS